jgi:hypothetical protein
MEEVCIKCNKNRSDDDGDRCPCGEKWSCGECYGEGSVEVMVRCGKPASSCCGGCTKVISCPSCMGGEYEDNRYYDDGDDRHDYR